MKIGIMSDTHDKLENLAKAVKLFQNQQVDLIIHCGDWVSPFVPQYMYSLEPKLTIPVKSVFGNNEGDHFRFFERKAKEGWDIEFKKETLSLELDGKKIVVYHGSDSLLTEGLILSGKYDVVFTGHTHRSVIETKGNTLHVNPGSVSGYAFGRIEKGGSVAVYDTRTNKALLHTLE